MEGWVKLYRQIVDNPLWTKEPFTAGQAWVDLLLLANHKEQKVLLNGSWGVVGRGQILTSAYKLAERWKWSRGKVARFLDVLKMDKMLDIECSKGGTTNGTTLTVVNYSFYQGDDTTNDTTLDTTNGLRTDINKNVKNVKNIYISTPSTHAREENSEIENKGDNSEPQQTELLTDERKEKKSAQKEKNLNAQFGELLKTDTNYLATFYENTHVPSKEFPDYLKGFLEELELSCKSHTNYNDFRRHFISWARMKRDNFGKHKISNNQNLFNHGKNKSNIDFRLVGTSTDPNAYKGWDE